MLNKLSLILTKKDKKLFVLLILFSIIVSFIEVLGISLIMPFLSMSIDFSYIQNNQYLYYVYEMLNFKSYKNFVIFVGICLVVFYFLRSIINILYTYTMAKFSQGRYHFFVYRLFENYLGMPYKDFIKKNSSMLTKSIITEANNLAAFIAAFLLFVSECIVMIFIYSLLLYVNLEITLLISVFLILNAIVLLKTVSKKMKSHGTKRAKIQKVFYEIINRTFSNFKLIKLQNQDINIINEFRNKSREFANVNITAQTLLQIPKFILEAIAFSIVILIVLYLIWNYSSDISELVGLLSIFILALYRMMPSVNRILSSYNQMLFMSRSLELIHSDLMYDVENLGDSELKFNNRIIVRNLAFCYEKNKTVLKNIELEIIKGEKIAFTGESGSGKSTLVDLIIGLYKPKSGEIIIDDLELTDENIKQWRKKIGYIPQSVYLFDGTVKENILFGEEEDEEHLITCLKQARIYDFLLTKEGLDTVVGEGGVMLSGGQKQRIAIARALYTKPEILVLDEATSALDDETEEEIMNEIYDVSTNKTLVIIAHRLNTVSRCDKVYTIEDGKIFINSYIQKEVL